MVNRGAGILLPIISLPSKYGIGTLGKEAYRFIDFLQKAKQSYWQILPLGPTSYGDSPYQSFSTYAGNPYHIDLELLVEDGLIDMEKLKNVDFGNNSQYIDYEKLYNCRFDLLKKAFANAEHTYSHEIEIFRNENKNWIEDYALYMSLKYEKGSVSWLRWDDGIRLRCDASLAKVRMDLKKDVEFWVFVQYMFFKQYFSLKKYANEKGVSIIGDVPIYVSEDSVDVWSKSEVFLLDDNKMPKLVAGVPPDYFSKTGQLWGNPVYDWAYLKDTSYEWWIDRIRWSYKLYDVIRIDHFRGFDEFWAVGYGAQDARDGEWLPSLGGEMLDAAREALGELNIIAEDLGVITDSVKELIRHTGYPGMKVLQFAFDGRSDNPYLPRNYNRNCVAYTGTHDNDTLKGWFGKLDEHTKTRIVGELGIENNEEVNYDVIKVIYDSDADLCVIPMQDFLCIGTEGRVNTPGVKENNWQWRMKYEHVTDELAQKIKDMVIKSRR